MLTRGALVSTLGNQIICEYLTRSCISVSRACGCNPRLLQKGSGKDRHPRDQPGTMDAHALSSSLLHLTFFDLGKLELCKPGRTLRTETTYPYSK